MSVTYVPRYEPGPRLNMVSINVTEARRITRQALTNVTRLRDEIEQREMQAEKEKRLAVNARLLVRLLPVFKMKTTAEAIRAACPSFKKHSAGDARLKYLLLQGTTDVAKELLEKWRHLDDKADVLLKKRLWERLIEMSDGRNA